MRSAARSATAIVGAFVLPRGTDGHDRRVDDAQALDAVAPAARASTTACGSDGPIATRADRVVERLRALRRTWARMILVAESDAGAERAASDVVPA